MKPTPSRDFHVVVHDEESQHWDLDHPEAFSGIYSVVLNHAVTIYFVPEVDDLQRGWPPVFNEDFDGIATARAARLELLQLGYAITPETEIAGKHDQLGDDGTGHLRIWFIDPLKFKLFESELRELSEDLEVSTLNKGAPISQLAEYEVIRFVVDELVLGGMLSDNDREFVTTMTKDDSMRWLRNRTFRPWSIELNDVTRTEILGLLKKQRLKIEEEAPDQLVATGRGRRAVVSLMRRGLNGMGDYLIGILKDDRILDWREDIDALGHPYRICRGDTMPVFADYLNRSGEVSSTKNYTSPSWQPRLKPDAHPPIGDGYELKLNLYGDGITQIWTAENAQGDRFLATIAHVTPPFDELEAQLSNSCQGLLAFESLHPLGTDKAVMFEYLPSGIPLSEVVLPLREQHAAAVLCAIGETLQHAMKAGIDELTLRPELIWVSEQEGRLDFEALTDRNSILSAATKPMCFGTIPLWVRRYTPKNESGPSAMVYNLALLLCELQLGGHPINTQMWAGYVDLKPTLSNALELLPPGSAEMVRQGLEPADKRPSLDEMIEALRKLAENKESNK